MGYQGMGNQGLGNQGMVPMRLKFVDSDDLGITRRKLAHGWAYYSGDGARITDRDEIDRLNRIALPPAYTDARFSAFANGHLQAFGLDARGRRQYRYHPEYRAHRDGTKFDNVVAFGAALPAIRKQVEADLGGKACDCSTVLAAIVRIMDSAHIRVGNEEYARTNKSFGATTLRNRHARAGREKVQLHYRGKSGIERQVVLSDRSLARVVRRCQDLPGQSLFQYVDDDGARCRVGSGEVNAYIRAISGGDFTAKDFRTWGASAIGYGAVTGGMGLAAMLETVSSALGNTPAIARKAYVHPAVIELATDGQGEKQPLPRKTQWLAAEERGLIEYLSNGRGSA